MIDIIARIGTPIAQKLVIKYVLKINDGSEVQRSLFHLSAIYNPISVSTISTISICYLNYFLNEKLSCV